jgi:hypothetical protein
MFAVEELKALLKRNRAGREIADFLRNLETLSPVEIDDKDGTNDEIIECKGLGLSFYFEDDLLRSISLHTARQDTGYYSYAGLLPAGVTFQSTKSDLARLMGEPIEKGGGKAGFFGNVNEWVKYRFEEDFLHIEFDSMGSSIRMVTLLASEDDKS